MNEPDKDDEAISYGRVASFWNQRAGEAKDPRSAGFSLNDAYPDEFAGLRFRVEQRYMERVISGLARRDRALDLGCGAGTWSFFLAERFREVVALDVAPGMTRLVSERAEADGVRNLSVRTASLLGYDGPGDFDLVFLGGVLMYHNNADLPTALDRLARLVRPGGRILVRESTHAKRTWYRTDSDYHAIYRPPELYARLFRETGFRVERMWKNLGYSYVDVLEDYYRLVDRLTRGRLRRSPAAGRALYRAVAWTWPLSLTAFFHLTEWTGLNSTKLRNHYYLLDPGGG